MKTIILVSLCLCLFATVISADKSHKHQDKLLKSDHEEREIDTEVQAVAKDKSDLKTHTETKPEQTETKAEQTETKPAGTVRKHRNNHHRKNKKGATNTESHTGRSRKVQQTKPNKHTGQRSHNNKHHGRKHGRGKQTQ